MAAPDGASSSSSSFSGSSTTYDVFLNFRGEDTRNNFTGFLHMALEKEGIHVFIDSEDLWGGEEIQPALIRAIQRSKISIPIFSKAYADSKWCLRELVEIVQCHRSGQIILPIFLDVDPTDVRHQTGTFERSFQKHGGKFDAEIEDWKKALTVVAGITGYEPKQVNGNQSKLVLLVVDRALKALKTLSKSSHLGVIENPIGLKDRVEDLLSKLNVGSNDVRLVGICGIGGIGKTTIAKALYHHIFNKFHSFCFLANIKEAASGPNGLVSLQEQLICSVSKKRVDRKIWNVHSGQEMIKELHGENILLILDDVDDHSQLKAFAIEFNWFGPGSRIIITSRDEHILNVAKVDGDNIYRPNELDDEESLQLFSLHAFSMRQPPDDYKQLSHDVIQLARGLPLTLEVLGSSLICEKDKKVWESMIKKLKIIPNAEVHKKLKISYDSLEEEEKSIFLDAACFFVGWRKEIVISIWDACGFDPIPAIKKLTQRSLLIFTERVSYVPTGTISDSYDKLKMHDQIQAMGRRIVLEESIREPSERSRLWSREEILEVLEEHKGTQNIEGILPPSYELFSSVCLHKEDFVMMSKLRFLYLDGARSKGQFPHLPSSLRWLSWGRCPLEYVQANFYHKKLVHMDLSRSLIRQAWTDKPRNANERFQNLKVLCLRECVHLSKSPDFSWFPNLEILDLGDCYGMLSVHAHYSKTFGDLKSLVELHLDGTKIKELPNNICRLKSLKCLILRSCSSLEILPESIGDLKSLVELHLDGTKIEELSNNISKMSSLKRLTLTWCSSLKNLPESIGDLKSLVELHLDGTKIEELPNSICRMSSLKYLILSSCSSLKYLPESIGELKSLVQLDLKGTQIREIPSSICRLNSLKDLNLSSCTSLENLPESIGDLKSLVELSLDRTNIEELPSSICRLSFLERLNLDMCESLNKLPETIGDLQSLVELSLDRTKVKELPNSTCRLSSLKRLNLYGCESLNKLPNSIGDLKSLIELSLGGTKVGELPNSICMLSSLQRLDLFKCGSLKKLPKSIGDLNSLVDLCLDRTKIKKLPNELGLLEKLEVLSAMDCNNLVQLPVSMGRMRCLRIINFKGTNVLLPRDDSIILPSLVELKIGSKLESSLPPWISGLPRLQKLQLLGCPRLQSLPLLPSTLAFLKVVDCMSLLKLPDLSNLKNLKKLRLCYCEKLEEIQGLEGTESLEDLYLEGCNIVTGAPGKKLGQGTLLVDALQTSHDSLNIKDMIYKWLVLCIVFAFRKEKKVQGNLQEGELVTIRLLLEASIRQKDRRILCVVGMPIEDVQFTTERDISCIHHFKGFDWFGLPLVGKDAIEITCSEVQLIPIAYENKYVVEGEVKFCKLLFERTEPEEQMPILEASASMVAGFFSWSTSYVRRPHFALHEQAESSKVSNSIPKQAEGSSHQHRLTQAMGLLGESRASKRAFLDMDEAAGGPSESSKGSNSVPKHVEASFNRSLISMTDESGGPSVDQVFVQEPFSYGLIHTDGIYNSVFPWVDSIGVDQSLMRTFIVRGPDPLSGGPSESRNKMIDLNYDLELRVGLPGQGQSGGVTEVPQFSPALGLSTGMLKASKRAPLDMDVTGGPSEGNNEMIDLHSDLDLRLGIPAQGQAVRVGEDPKLSQELGLPVEMLRTYEGARLDVDEDEGEAEDDYSHI
ncbi:disease resistance protein RPV1-like [Macadamia integrifolia]|uniref:disease resistance protein RPV1-like n=1 Tax=Macadamia integrifolia TaxID=60698 RepID=UPI001C4E50A6|nr:disease resistance protein RPV1-like [Macadamia integrifolia]